MSIINKCYTGLICFGVAFAAAPAIAGDLTVQNNTDFYSTTVTNDFMCSANLPGGGGITSPKSKNVISDRKVKIACLKDKTNCKADVYLTNNCTGPKIATVYFDVNSGIKGDPQMHDQNYKIIGTGFYIQMDYAK